jgi:hypothetical protein
MNFPENNEKMGQNLSFLTNEDEKLLLLVIRR